MVCLTIGGVISGRQTAEVVVVEVVVVVVVDVQVKWRWLQLRPFCERCDKGGGVGATRMANER